MGFNTERFRQAQLKQRTGSMTIAELKDWFDEGSEPVFHYRALDAVEFYRVIEAPEKRETMKALAEAIMTRHGPAIAEAVHDLVDEVPRDYIKRVEILNHGLIEPKLDHETILKFYKHFPVFAHTIAEAILRLTGEGSTLGELNGSGGNPVPSGTSISATNGGSASLS